MLRLTISRAAYTHETPDMELLRCLPQEIREKRMMVAAEYVDEDSDGLLDRCLESSDILESRTEVLLFV